MFELIPIKAIAANPERRRRPLRGEKVQALARIMLLGGIVQGVGLNSEYERGRIWT
jgi:hypothetical protein